MRPQRPYNAIIFFSFQAYQKIYPNLLERYERAYSIELEDDTELFFWKDQKRIYEESLLNVTLEQKDPSGMENNLYGFYPKSLSMGSLQRYLDSDSIQNNVVHRENGVHGEYGAIDMRRKSRYDNLFRVFSKILRFIDKRIFELNNPKLLSIPNLPKSKVVEKIIYLNELGVIDLLKTKTPFNTSVNSLATVLSTILKERADTLQPYLNALINGNKGTKNHPYNSDKT